MLHKIFLSLLLTSSTFVYSDVILAEKREDAAKVPGACHFAPPMGWELIDSKVLLPEVKAMVKGKSLKPSSLPPSINLATEETDLTLEEYLTAVKEINSSERNKRWARVGSIRTRAGEMCLTQLDLPTQWGEARMVQAIMVKDHRAYVLTATAQLDEFAAFSSEFLKSIQSFDINKEKS